MTETSLSEQPLSILLTRSFLSTVGHEILLLKDALTFVAYDIKRIADKFRAEVLEPAGLPDLPVWATEYEPAPFPALPT